MTVGELKEFLEKIDDEVPVVVDGYDHRYFSADCFVCEAIDSSGEYLEPSSYDDERSIEVVVIR